MNKSILLIAVLTVFTLFIISCDKDKKTEVDEDTASDRDVIYEDADVTDNDDPAEIDDETAGADDGLDDIDEDSTDPDDDVAEVDIFFTQISTGGEHSCVIDTEGRAYCWGNNGSGQLGNGKEMDSAVPVRVGVSEKIVSVNCGNAHACAISDTGKTYCWGDNSFGQLANDKIYDSDSSSLPVEIDTSGVLKDKLLVQVLADEYSTFAIDSDGKLYGWGRNESGQIGAGTAGDSDAPLEVDMTGALNGKKIASVDSGSEHSCAVDDAGKVYCWGSNENGQLGDGGTTDSLVPVEVDMGGDLSGKEIAAVSAGEGYTCALDTEGSVYCWGEGIDSEVYSPLKVDLGDIEAVSINVKGKNACVLDSLNKIFCWGRNFRGQLGDGTENDSSTPVEVNMSGALKDKTITSVGTGSNFTCAIDNAGDVYCWGANTNGQCGNGIYDILFDKGSAVKVVKESALNGKKAALMNLGGKTANVTDSEGKVYTWGDFKLIPFAFDSEGILKDKVLSSMSSGDYHTCAIDKTNIVYCWGNNGNGQLGNNSTVESYTPVAVDLTGVLKDKTIKLISAGGAHTCVIDSDGIIYCWGSNKYGQLGNGETADSLVPVEVDMTGVLKGKIIKSIQSGRVHTCVLDSEGLVYCWGGNSKEQLGDKTAVDSAVPVKVDTSIALKGKKIVLLSAGGYHNCAVDDKSIVYCWGSNDLGQLGTGYETAHDTPSKVDMSGALKDKKITAIANGDNTTCTIDEDGAAYCWGSILGNEIKKSSVPSTVDMKGELKDKKLVSISVASSQVCSIDEEGEIYCWGDSIYGQLGSGITNHVKTPVKVFYSINDN